MGRPHRVFISGVTEHLTQRGTNRITVFEDAADFAWFLCRFKHAARLNGVSVHGYALMTNHIHLIVTGSYASAIPAMMRDLCGSYTRHFNRRHERIGHLWNGRYYPKAIGDESYWLTCLRYIEQNPVRAKMVATPDDYRWSSYAAHARGKWPDWLVPHPVYLALGHTDAERQRRYREICGQPLDTEQLAIVRCTIPVGSSVTRCEALLGAE